MQDNSKKQKETIFIIDISNEYCFEQTDSMLADVIHLILSAYKRKYIKDTSVNQSEN